MAPIFRFYGLGILLLLSGCCGGERVVYYDTDGGSYAYARDAYLEAEERKRRDICAVDECDLDHGVLDLSECGDTHEDLRQPYETVEEWQDRLHCRLCSNREQILWLQGELESIQSQEQAQAHKIQDLIGLNQQLREQQQLIEKKREKESAYEKVSLAGNAPFFVHLVRKGDTLYSISMRYYGNPHMVKQIMSWNQGWIRHPDEIIAGMGLVLFFESAPEKGPQVVERYIQQVQHISKNSAITQTP